MWYCCSELAQGSSAELRQRLDAAVEDRETTMQQAQQLADKLETTEAENRELTEQLNSQSGHADMLQQQLDELLARYVAVLCSPSL